MQDRVNNTQNKDITNAVYTSNFVMHKALFYDFSLVSFNKTKKVFLAFLSFTVFEIIANILAENYDIVSLCLFISLMMLFTYLKTKKAIKVNYERNLIAAGKESAIRYELFEDKIVSNVDESKREYFYHQITKFFETKNFILLHLQHNLFVTIEKSSLNANLDEVKCFLLEKCTLVKKKKFINCSNDEKWSLVFLIALIVVSILGTIIGIVLKFNSSF